MDSTKRKKENDYSLMSEWFKLQREMWNNEGNNDVINTTPILQEFMKQCHIQNYFFQSFNQNDCQ